MPEADKTAHHPDGQHIIRFRSHNHTYIDNYGTRYVSGTTFIKPFFPQFDAVAMSIKCSQGNNPKYAGRAPEEIREEWRAEGERGSKEGDNVHLYAEHWGKLSPGQDIRPISERCRLLFLQVDNATRILVEKGFICIGNEFIVFSPSLRVAGTIDKLMFDPAKQEILILDWKQNKETPSNTNAYQSALPPIDHLRDTEISKYSLQLSLYKHILINENYFPAAKGYRMALIHLFPAKAAPIKIEDHDYEIKELLKYAKRN